MQCVQPRLVVIGVLYTAGEDDGYLLVYVYHSHEQVSKLHVYDAKSMAPQPVATVALPQRVPYGFHGLWVSQRQMAQQRQQQRA